MATKETDETATSTTANGTERQRKAPEAIVVGATHDATKMLQVGASIPGDVYDALVNRAATRDGAVSGPNLVRSFLNSEVQRALFSHVGGDWDAWYAQYSEKRKEARKGAGSKGGTTKARTNVLSDILALPDDKLQLVLKMRSEGKTAEEIQSVIFAS